MLISVYNETAEGTRIHDVSPKVFRTNFPPIIGNSVLDEGFESGHVVGKVVRQGREIGRRCAAPSGNGANSGLNCGRASCKIGREVYHVIRGRAIGVRRMLSMRPMSTDVSSERACDRVERALARSRLGSLQMRAVSAVVSVANWVVRDVIESGVAQ